jgi:hypothetical protein
MLKKIKYWLHQRALNNVLKTLSHSHKSVPFSEVKSVGILFDAEEPNNELAVKKLMQQLQQKNIKVEVLGYIAKLPKNRGKVIFDYFTEKEVSMALVPQQSVLNGYADKPFDLLLNLYTTEILPLEYISAVSKATFRMGRYIAGKDYYCDMMISLKATDTLENLIEQTLHYLNQINPQPQHA